MTLMSKALTWMISHGCVEFTDTHVGKPLLGRLDTYVKNVDTDVTNKNMEVDTHVKTANTDVTLTPMSRTHAHMDVSCTDIHDKNLYLGRLDTYVKDVDTDVTNTNMQVDTHVKTANTDVMTKTCTWAP